MTIELHLTQQQGFKTGPMNTFSLNPEQPIPRIGEHIRMNAKEYKVDLICYDYDKTIILISANIVT